MRKPSALATALALFFTSFVFYAPPVQAQPEFAVWWIYYDSSLQENGWQHRDCGNNWSSSGTLSGQFKEVLSVRCGQPFDEYYEYYNWCGYWNPVAYLGDTSCP